MLSKTLKKFRNTRQLFILAKMVLKPKATSCMGFHTDNLFVTNLFQNFKQRAYKVLGSQVSKAASIVNFRQLIQEKTLFYYKKLLSELCVKETANLQYFAIMPSYLQASDLCTPSTARKAKATEFFLLYLLFR